MKTIDKNLSTKIPRHRDAGVPRRSFYLNRMITWLGRLATSVFLCLCAIISFTACTSDPDAPDSTRTPLQLSGNITVAAIQTASRAGNQPAAAFFKEGDELTVEAYPLDYHDDYDEHYALYTYTAAGTWQLTGPYVIYFEDVCKDGVPTYEFFADFGNYLEVPDQSTAALQHQADHIRENLTLDPATCTLTATDPMTRRNTLISITLTKGDGWDGATDFKTYIEQNLTPVIMTKGGKTITPLPAWSTGEVTYTAILNPTFLPAPGTAWEAFTFTSKASGSIVHTITGTLSADMTTDKLRGKQLTIIAPYHLRAGFDKNITFTLGQWTDGEPGGEWTGVSPEVAAAKADFLAWAEAVRGGENRKDFTLTANIDISDITDWKPVCIETYNQYAGTFDGGGHTITGLTVNVTEAGSYSGLFGHITYAGTVKNLHLRRASVTSSGYAGGVAASNYGTIAGCTVQGTVTSHGYGHSGGIAGNNQNIIIGCAFHGDVTATRGIAGGIAGGNTNTTALIATLIAACTMQGTVTGEMYAGGIVGDNYSATITGCYSLATAVTCTGVSAPGGIVGANGTSATVTSCYWLTGAGVPTIAVGKEEETTTVAAPFAGLEDFYAEPDFMEAMNRALMDIPGGILYWWVATPGGTSYPVAIEADID